jgi:hypothetical protein
VSVDFAGHWLYVPTAPIIQTLTVIQMFWHTASTNLVPSRLTSFHRLLTHLSYSNPPPSISQHTTSQNPTSHLNIHGKKTKLPM